MLCAEWKYCPFQVSDSNKGRIDKPKDTKIVDHIRALEIKVKAQLDDFVEDESVTELELEPMEKDLRFICHDVVQEYENLVSASVGEEDQR